MEISTVNHSFNDAVRQIVQLFFDIDSDIKVKSVLEEDGFNLIAFAEISVNDKKGAGKATIKKTTERRFVSDLIKKSVSLACREISDMPSPWGISTGIRPAKEARQMLEEGRTDGEILSFFENEMWITKEKALLSLDVAKREKEILKNKRENGVSIYVRIPFCPTRCAYCSFISQAVEHNEKFIEPYVKALIKEIEATAKLCEKRGDSIETVYFGGGTPTALSTENLRALIEAVKKNFDLSKLREFTVEAGRPDTFTEEMVSMLYDSGVGRISINPQTMNDKTLKSIGRRHTAEQTVDAFNMAKKYNFSINADLIAGLPEETAEDFKYTMDNLLKLNPDAVTVHTMYLKRAARLIDDFSKYRFVTEANAIVSYAKSVLEENGFNPYYLYKQKNTLGNLENPTDGKSF